MKKNLIVCSTPLQIVIAERIIDLHLEEEFWPIVYSPYDTIPQKYHHYIRRLEAKCQRKVKIVYPKYTGGSLRAFVRMLWDYCCGYLLPKFDCIIKAEAKSEDTLYLTHRLQDVELKTFDDGMVNLAIATYYREDAQKGGRLYRMMTKLFGISIDNESFQRRLTEHFTIYKQENIVKAPKMTYINLFHSKKDNSQISKEIKEEVRIFLGQPIYEFEYGQTHRSLILTQYLVNKYKIQYYFAHPREQYQLSDVEYICSPLIFEDYVMQELSQNEDKVYKIYTYCSTILLNLQNTLDNIEFTAIYPTDCPERLKETYDLIRACGISIVEVDTSQI